MNYQAIAPNIDDDLKNWIDSQYLGFTYVLAYLYMKRLNVQ